MGSGSYRFRDDPDGELAFVYDVDGYDGAHAGWSRLADDLADAIAPPSRHRGGDLDLAGGHLPLRASLALTYRARGETYETIGRTLGITANGAAYIIRRAKTLGRVSGCHGCAALAAAVTLRRLGPPVS